MKGFILRVKALQSTSKDFIKIKIKALNMEQTIERQIVIYERGIRKE